MADIETPKTTPSWEKDHSTLEALGEDTLACILERKHAQKFGVGTEELDARIQKSLIVFKEGVRRMEEGLSTAEELGGIDKPTLRRWETSILNLSKQYDRLEVLSRGEDDSLIARNELFRNASATKGKAVRFSEPLDDGDARELDHGESLQLQRRIMDEQDAHLDELSETIARQKHIGLMINDELDLHVDLLEETEERVDRTSSRLRGAGRRLERVLEDSVKNSKGTTIIAILVVILILVIVIARKV